MNLLGRTLIFGIRLYRWILSPAKVAIFGPSARCRHVPSCSQYAMEAIKVHGPAHGGWLSLKRLARCHPWGTSGHDPVPRPVGVVDRSLTGC